MSAHGGIDCKAEHVVELVVANGADDVGRADDVPARAGLFAVGEETVFLAAEIR